MQPGHHLHIQFFYIQLYTRSRWKDVRAVNSVPASVAVFRKDSKSFSCVMDIMAGSTMSDVCYNKLTDEPFKSNYSPRTIRIQPWPILKPALYQASAQSDGALLFGHWFNCTDWARPTTPAKKILGRKSRDLTPEDGQY